MTPKLALPIQDQVQNLKSFLLDFKVRLVTSNPLEREVGSGRCSFEGVH